MSNFMKIYTVEPSCSVRTDRLAKLIISFRSFANAPKNCIVILDHGEPPYRRMCVCVCMCVCTHMAYADRIASLSVSHLWMSGPFLLQPFFRMALTKVFSRNGAFCLMIVNTWRRPTLRRTYSMQTLRALHRADRAEYENFRLVLVAHLISEFSRNAQFRAPYLRGDWIVFGGAYFICGPSMWILFRVTLLAPRVFRCFLDLWTICAPPLSCLKCNRYASFWVVLCVICANRRNAFSLLASFQT